MVAVEECNDGAQKSTVAHIASSTVATVATVATFAAVAAASLLRRLRGHGIPASRRPLSAYERPVSGMEWRAHLLASRYFLASCRLRELAIRSGRHQPRHGPQLQRHSCPGRGIPKFGHAHRRCHVRAGQRHDLRAAVRKGMHAVRLNDTRSRQQHHPTDVDRYFWARCRSDARMRSPATS